MLSTAARLRVHLSHGVAARFASSRGPIIGLMPDDDATPFWICKSATGNLGVRRLRAEYHALVHLAPWADELQVPRVISWEDADDECCLVQSGIDGLQDDTGLSTHLSEAQLNRRFLEVLAWIDKFQTVALPGFRRVIDVAAACAAQIEGRSEFSPAAAPVIQMLRNLGSLGLRSAVPTHGDFHWRNVLQQHPGVGVIDWASFTSGFPLQDRFSYIVNNVYFEPGRYFRLVENYRHVFFSESTVCRWLASLLRSWGYSPQESSQWFYCFLASQLCLDADMPAQTWLEILDFLASHSYPPLATPLPPPR